MEHYQPKTIIYINMFVARVEKFPSYRIRIMVLGEKKHGNIKRGSVNQLVFWHTFSQSLPFFLLTYMGLCAVTFVIIGTMSETILLFLCQLHCKFKFRQFQPTLNQKNWRKESKTQELVCFVRTLTWTSTGLFIKEWWIGKTTTTELTNLSTSLNAIKKYPVNTCS